MVKNKEPWSAKKKIIMVIITFLYTISPIDIVPDIIPFAGWIDDLCLIIFTFIKLFQTSPHVYESTKTAVRKFRQHQFTPEEKATAVASAVDVVSQIRQAKSQDSKLPTSLNREQLLYRPVQDIDTDAIGGRTE